MKESSENPCKKEFEELRLATLEWSRAADECKEYAFIEELSVDTALLPKSQAYFDQMRAAYNKEEEARRIYFQKVQAALDCQSRHKSL
jgi:hypothetical protein